MEFLKFLERNKVRISAIAGVIVSNLPTFGAPDNVVKSLAAILAVVVATNVGHVMAKDKH